jgi:TetR/AcrR family transcriptional regulator
MVLQFSEKNPGMTRVMVGDALVFENERLQQRMNLFIDKIEATLRQSLRAAAQSKGSDTPSVEAQVRASALTAFILGRMQRFARSGFQRSPLEHLDASLAMLV